MVIHLMTLQNTNKWVNVQVILENDLPIFLTVAEENKNIGDFRF